jgi:hypothetical protein
MVERAAHPIFGEVAAALEQTNVALRAGDLGLAEHAVDLLLASGMDSNDSLQALREAARHASEEGPAPAGR